MNFKNILLVLFFIFSSLLAVFHAAGVGYFLYDRFAWFDILTHALGGVAVMLGVLWLAFSFGFLKKDTLSKKGSLLAAVALVILAGVTWEIFELWVGVPREARYFLDTSLDLIMDTAGALASYVIVNLI